MTTFREILNIRPAPQSNGAQLFGIECECENVVPMSYSADSPVLAAGWSVTEDGSLRGAGVEFLTPPVPLTVANDMLRTLYRTKDRYEYTTSVRTSMHVHVNMQDDTFGSLENVLGAYCVLEPLLFELCGTEREENIYCVPFYRAKMPLIQFRRIKNNLISWRDVNKYSALNLGAIVKFGTIEFRHAPLWDSLAEAQTWLGIIDELVQQGRQRTPHELLDMLGEIGVVETVERLLPTYASTLISNYHARHRNDLSASLDTWLLDHDIVSLLTTLRPLKCADSEASFKWKFENLHTHKNSRAADTHVAEIGLINVGPTNAYQPDQNEDEDDYEEYRDEEDYMENSDDGSTVIVEPPSEQDFSPFPPLFTERNAAAPPLPVWYAPPHLAQVTDNDELRRVQDLIARVRERITLGETTVNIPLTNTPRFNPEDTF